MLFNLVSCAVAIAILVLISASDVAYSFKMEPKYFKYSTVSGSMLFNFMFLSVSLFPCLDVTITLSFSELISIPYYLEVESSLFVMSASSSLGLAQQELSSDKIRNNYFL